MAESMARRMPGKPRATKIEVTPYHFGRGLARWQPLVLLLPGLLLYLILAVGPALATTVYSFTDANGIAAAEVHWIGWQNYREFLLLGQAARENLAAVGRTLWFCFWVTTVQFVLGLVVAVVVNQRLRGVSVFRTIYFMPVILGVTIQGLMWRLFLYPLDGPASKLLDLIGMHSEFLGGPPAVKFAWVIAIQIWANLGITMMVFLAGLQTIPAELTEAARIDGASNWDVFRHVTWPLLTPSVNTNLTLNIIGSLQAWQLFLVLIGYTPNTQVLGYVVYAQGFAQASGSPTGAAMRQGFAAAAGIVQFLMVLAIGLTTIYLLRRREEKLLG
jgi:raffinose/stachyose/melibiose transport system permease protein